MNSARKTMSVVQLAARQFSRSAVRNEEGECLKVTKRFQRLKENQQRFQLDDGVPVHLKSGFGDKILFQVTTVALVVGLGLAAKTAYGLIFPKPKK